MRETKAAGFQLHKRLYLQHDLHGEDGSEDIIGVAKYLQVKQTKCEWGLWRFWPPCGCVEQTCASARPIVSLTMFLKEWDLIGSSAASEMLLRMMKMRMKLVK